MPAYEAQHRVLPSQWAFPEDLVSEVVVETNKETPQDGGRNGEHDDERVIDLSQGPPEYEYSEDQAHFREEEESQLKSSSMVRMNYV